ncbi:hypothetical protein PR048_031919 [Dryococelus australis]|uniref:Uncharacterized protein n=1 Tax=Dryococelus australis TaxID=614101 RepID=A0ABQ9G6N2_9NEOP|nr:hypothetical protein PR048_031919 [Dryococelus australis]
MQLKMHTENDADCAYCANPVTKLKPKKDPSKRCLTFDLQQCLPTPCLAFHKRQLWTFNLAVYDTSGNSVNYMWHEGLTGRGAMKKLFACITISAHFLKLSQR